MARYTDIGDTLTGTQNVLDLCGEDAVIHASKEQKISLVKSHMF
jgi:hypothetical protein